MTLHSRSAARCAFITLIAVLLIAGVCLQVRAGGRLTGEACDVWHESRLILDPDLERRRFLLEPKGPLEFMPPFSSGEGRPVYHQTHALTLDVAEELSVFYSDRPSTCVLARDPARKQALKIPVFFVGRAGETRDELKDNAERLAFTASASLDGGQSFADVNFRLKRGGSRFGDIKPFFRCGLTGLLVCEGSCPDDSLPLAASLVNWVVKGKPWREAPAQAPAAPPFSPPKTAQAPTPPATPAPQAPTLSPPPEAPRAQGPAASPAPPSPPQPPAPPLKHVLLTFKTKSGETIEPDLVLQAEDGLKFDGVALAPESGSLAADVPVDDIQKANGELRTLLKHHIFIMATENDGRIEVTVEQLYVRADDVAIKITDASGDFVDRCDVSLETFANRRLGKGWEQGAVRTLPRGLPYALAGDSYLLDIPYGVGENELLIATADPGSAGKILNFAKGCDLEGPRIVTAEELRTQTIARSLRQVGPTLFALFSTDSGFASTLPSAFRDFWSEALGLATAVSDGTWERKILARAQSPEASGETRILDDADAGILLAQQDQARSEILTILEKGSQRRAQPFAAFEPRPIERFHLDVALKALREQAGIAYTQSAGQESLLVIAGSIKAGGSEFCRRENRGDGTPSHRPLWLRQARKAFVLEVWSEDTARIMQQERRAERAENSGDGVFRCKIGSSDADKVELYAVSQSVLEADQSRAEAFSYLKNTAVALLKP
jgi:hypothetical protein